MIVLTSKKLWSALNLTTLLDTEIIGADPSISAFGLVYISIIGGQVYVNGAETIRTTQTEDGGWESNFDRAEELGFLLEDSIRSMVGPAYERPYLIAAHEAPPAGGGNIMRPESSILGGREFRRACTTLGIPLDKLVTPQSHKKLICGNHIAKKKEHHDALRNLLPQIHESRLITNEATRDALSIALYSAYRTQ